MAAWFNYPPQSFQHIESWKKMNHLKNLIDCHKTVEEQITAAQLEFSSNMIKKNAVEQMGMQWPIVGSHFAARSRDLSEACKGVDEDLRRCRVRSSKLEIMIDKSKDSIMAGQEIVLIHAADLDTYLLYFHGRFRGRLMVAPTQDGAKIAEDLNARKIMYFILPPPPLYQGPVAHRCPKQ